jgi:hypothetical protein
MSISIKAFLLLTILLSGLTFFNASQAARFSGVEHRDWQNWSFDYQVNGRLDGISLTKVKYKGVEILGKASLPVMRVFYDDDACGPYADRLGGDLTPISWANNNLVVLREFTQSGRQWLEVGIQDTIGNYVIYQSWYLSSDGILDGHIFSKGLQCNIDHIHYPYWRMDFDLAGRENDQIRKFVGGDWQTISTESNESVTTANNHRWQVRDTVTGDSVNIEFSAAGWNNINGTVVPEDNFANNLLLGRRYQSNENRGWTHGAHAEVPYNNGENIDGQDLVVWYKGYLPHTAAEGPDLWHSTGVRIVVNLADNTNPPPDNNEPNITHPGNQTKLVGDSVSLQIEASGSNSLSYSATGLPLGISINNETGLITGTVSAAGENSSTVIVTDDSNGMAAQVIFIWTVSDSDGGGSTPSSTSFDFETDQGWVNNAAGTDTASTGQWGRSNPSLTTFDGVAMQPDNAAEGEFALITDGQSGSRLGSFDVDNGVTTMKSPNIDLTEASQANLSFSYFFAHLGNANSDDYLRVKIVGSTTSTVLEKRGTREVVGADWQTHHVDISEFAGQSVYILVEAADAGRGSLIEAGIDSVDISTQ